MAQPPILPPSAPEMQNSISSDIAEVHRLAKESWHGKEINKIGVFDSLRSKAVAGVFSSLTADDRQKLDQDLATITEKIGALDLRQEEKSSCIAKIQSITTHLTPMQEVQIEVKPYTSLDKLRRKIEHVATSLQCRPIDEKTINSLTQLIWLHDSLISPSMRVDEILRFLKIATRTNSSLFLQLADEFMPQAFDVTEWLRLDLLSREELLELAPGRKKIILENVPEAEKEFITKFLNHAQQGVDLSIDDSYLDEKILASIANCNARNLKIGNCSFNCPLPEKMNSLETLCIKNCGNFNQPLPKEMNSLDSIQLIDCQMFNQPLPKKLEKVGYLSISGCTNFNQPLPEGMKALRNLSIFGSKTFNKPLSPESAQLFRLLITSCPAFNQPLPKAMDEILYLELARCSCFNQPLPESMPKLQYIDLSQCTAFKPFDHSPRTLLTFAKYCAREFNEHCLPLTPEEKEAILRSVSTGTSESLPIAERLVLCPLLSPDAIQISFSEVLDTQRASWLQERIRYEDLDGDVKRVMKDVKNLHLGPQSNAEAIAPTIRKFLNVVPLLSLSSLCMDDEGIRIILSYLAFFNENQLACTVPLLPKEVLIDFLRNTPDLVHLQYLALATNEQRNYYLAQDLLAKETLSVWHETQKPKLDQMIAACTSEEQCVRLQTEMELVRQGLLTALQRYKHTLSRLQTMLQKTNPKVLAYVEEKTSQLAKVETELKQRIQRAESLRPYEIPDEFYDTFGTLMTEPMYLEKESQTLDKTTWGRLTHNPFTRTPFKMEDLRPNTTLMQKIAHSQQDHRDAWKRT